MYLQEKTEFMSNYQDLYIRTILTHLKNNTIEFE